MALGSSSITVPLNSIISSFDIRPQIFAARKMLARPVKVKQ
jgi:hypothetical protein